MRPRATNKKNAELAKAGSAFSFVGAGLAFEPLETFECVDVSAVARHADSASAALRARRGSLVLQQLVQPDHVALHGVTEGRADARRPGLFETHSTDRG